MDNFCLLYMYKLLEMTTGPKIAIAIEGLVAKRKNLVANEADFEPCLGCHSSYDLRISHSSTTSNVTNMEKIVSFSKTHYKCKKVHQ